MILYQAALDDSDLFGILALQKANLPENISQEEYSTQGFVTLRHDITLLKEMNECYPHIIAKAHNDIIGYTLITTIEIAKKVPLLNSTLNHLKHLIYEENPISEYRFFIMGQICVAKDYRGSEVFTSLYGQLFQKMKTDFDFIITEIAMHNSRSIRAHQKVGFITIHTHIENKIEWVIVLLDLRKIK